jgi:hypothetical protein
MQAVTRFHLRRGGRLDRLIKAKEALLFFARVRRRPLYARIDGNPFRSWR